MADEVDTVEVIAVAEGILDDPTAMEFDEYKVVTIGKGKSRLHEVRNRDKATVATFPFKYRDRAILFTGLYTSLRYLARGVKALFLENTDLAVKFSQEKHRVSKLRAENHRLKDEIGRLQTRLNEGRNAGIKRSVGRSTKPFTPEENVMTGPDKNFLMEVPDCDDSSRKRK